MTFDFRMRMAILANGEQVPLEQAAANYGLLRSHLESPDSEWDAVYFLRRLCLGHCIESEQLDVLVHEQLVDGDGRVSPAMKAVVLSAVRGEERLLHLDSPFTEPEDRKLGEILASMDSLPDALVEDVVASRIQGARVRTAIKNLPVPGDLIDPEEFAKRHWPQTSDPDDPADADRKPTSPPSTPVSIATETVDDILKRLKLGERNLPPNLPGDNRPR